VAGSNVTQSTTFGPTKGHERREVPLPRFLIDDLARHVAGKSSDALVFTGKRGAVMRSQTFQRAALTEAAKGLGMPGFHPHELRHPPRRWLSLPVLM
jgi:integrase